MPSTSVRSKTMYTVVPSTPIRLRSLSVRTVSGVPPSAPILKRPPGNSGRVVKPAAIRRPGWSDTDLDEFRGLLPSRFTSQIPQGPDCSNCWSLGASEGGREETYAMESPAGDQTGTPTITLGARSLVICRSVPIPTSITQRLAWPPRSDKKASSSIARARSGRQDMAGLMGHADGRLHVDVRRTVNRVFPDVASKVEAGRHDRSASPDVRVQCRRPRPKSPGASSSHPRAPHATAVQLADTASCRHGWSYRECPSCRAAMRSR